MNTTIAVSMAAALLCGTAGAALRLPGLAGDRSAVTLVSRSDGAVTVACQLGRLEALAVPAAAMDGASEDFLRLSLPDGGLTGEIGKPALPVLCAVLDVPHGAAIELSVDPGPARTVRLSDLGFSQRLAPALGPVPKVEGARPRFAIDGGTYGASAYYPAAPAEIDDIAARAGLARGHRLAAVRFHPVQYDPVAGTLRYYPRMTATVTFRGGDRAATAAAIARDYSPDWESFIGRLAVNHEAARHATRDSLLNLPVYYDIVHGGSYAAAAARLAEWKRRRGYLVRTWDATGWAAADIRDTMRAQAPRATYLAVISDPDGPDPLPPSATGAASRAATDLYYTETDGSGYLPDLFGARISVKTAEEAGAAVDKAIRYEQAEFGEAGSDWLKRALLIAGYDAWYQPVGIATNGYCRELLLRSGCAVDTLILASGEGKDRAVPLVNAGAAWTVYTAHGSETGWTMGGSSWGTGDLPGDLSNLDMYTMPAGHCCLSGKYQFQYDCFGEAWTRLAGKGGVGYFGSAPNTYWDEDDWLQRRYFDALYDSVPGTPGLLLSEAGRFTQFGLFWIEAHTATTLKRYYFEAYHLFNDPSLAFWTDRPAALTASYPAAIPAAAESMAVDVSDSATGSPVPSALVCAWTGGLPGVQAAGRTGATGRAVLPLSGLVGGDTVRITVTGRNRRPHLGCAVVNRLHAVVSPALVDVRHPTLLTVHLTDPDSGGAPARAVDVFAITHSGDTVAGAATDSAGDAAFTVTARDSHHLTLAGRRPGSGRVLFAERLAVREDLEITVLPRAVDINAPTAVTVAALNPHQQNEPVESLQVYLVASGADTAFSALTDGSGRARFILAAGQRTPVRLLLRWQRHGYDVRRDSILVSAPPSAMLSRPLPNPFAAAVKFRYQLSGDADVEIAVYDLLGRKVRTLVSGLRRTGYHSASWDGSNAAGAAAAAGIYFCRLKTTDTSILQKVLLIR